MIQNTTEKGERQRAPDRRDHVNSAKLTIGQVKFGAQLFAGQADKKGLPKGREKGQEKPTTNPTRIGAEKSDHSVRTITLPLRP